MLSVIHVYDTTSHFLIHLFQIQILKPRKMELEILFLNYFKGVG